MAYSEYLADRVRGSLKNLYSVFTEKNMFGGICFMVNDKMYRNYQRKFNGPHRSAKAR